MQERRGRLDVAILGGVALLGLLLFGLAAAGLYYLVSQSREARERAPSASPGVDAERAPEASLLGSGAPIEASAAIEAMRPRYVAGPYVEVDGLLPSGLASLRRVATGDAAARTQRNPFVVPGAELRPGALPSGLAVGAPAVALSPVDAEAGPLHLIPGVPASLTVATRSGEGDGGAVEGLYVAFEGYEGHFFLPSVVQSELGRVRVADMDAVGFHFGVDSPVDPAGAPLVDGKPLELDLLVAGVDGRGRVSEPVRRRLRVLPLGTGDLEVTLTMSRATDLDLYVVGPTGEMISYGNTQAFGGELDLDANAACETNVGVDNEHVFFRAGQAPAGTYHVRVAHFRSCIGGEPVDYRVTVRNCGETAVLSGRFEGEGDTQVCKGNPGARLEWCQHVVSFEVAPCRAL